MRLTGCYAGRESLVCDFDNAMFVSRYSLLWVPTVCWEKC